MVLEASAVKSICILQSRYDSTEREEYKNMKNVFGTCIVLHLTTSILHDVTFLKNMIYNLRRIKTSGVASLNVHGKKAVYNKYIFLIYNYSDHTYKALLQGS